MTGKHFTLTSNPHANANTVKRFLVPYLFILTNVHKCHIFIKNRNYILTSVFEAKEKEFGISNFYTSINTGYMTKKWELIGPKEGISSIYILHHNFHHNLQFQYKQSSFMPCKNSKPVIAPLSLPDLILFHSRSEDIKSQHFYGTLSLLVMLNMVKERISGMRNMPGWVKEIACMYGPR